MTDSKINLIKATAFFLKKQLVVFALSCGIALPFATKAQVVADPNGGGVVNFDDKADSWNDWIQMDRDNTGANCGLTFGDRGYRRIPMFLWNEYYEYKSACIGYINTPATNSNGGKVASMMGLGFMKWDPLNFFDKVYSSTNSGKDVLNLLPNGNVGIGTAAPETKLQVSNGLVSSVSTGTKNANGFIPTPDGGFPEFNASLTTVNNLQSITDPWSVFSKYSAGFIITSYPEGSIVNPALDIHTDQYSTQIVMQASGHAIMEMMPGVVIIGPDLPLPSVKNGFAFSSPGSLMASGNVRLGVRGRIFSDAITITKQHQWSDFVFDGDYKLKPLSEVESFIRQYKHLPDMPSATEIMEKGIDVTEMLKLQMQKIEEITLYVIQHEKDINALKKAPLVPRR